MMLATPVLLDANLGIGEMRRRAAYVRRFHLLPMLREQTVAEHQYAVWALLNDLPNMVDVSPLTTEWALVHDLPETVTGDIPTHVKYGVAGLKDMLDKVEAEIMPPEWVALRDTMHSREYARQKRLFKACDIADTLRMCHFIGDNTVAAWVMLPLREKLRDLISILPEGVQNHLLAYAYAGQS